MKRQGTPALTRRTPHGLVCFTGNRMTPTVVSEWVTRRTLMMSPWLTQGRASPAQPLLCSGSVQDGLGDDGQVGP